jgi:hypothetical protein
MRVALVVVTIGTLLSCSCWRPEHSKSTDKVDLTQNVTVPRNPESKSLADFEKKWRELISPSDELARAVISRQQPTGAPPRWMPTAMSDCVMSADGGAVPQVTLTWGSDDPRDPRSLRFDLAIVADGFARNQYSSLIPGTGADRFLLPKISALVKKEEAVLLTGPGLFAKAVFDVEHGQNPGTAARVTTYRLVLTNLSPGLTYTIRMDYASDDGWIEHGRYVFLTPVCPRGA